MRRKPRKTGGRPGSDPMEGPDPRDRRCTAHSKQSGGRCKRWAIPGGFVCVMHGGKSPQVRAKADERLADLIDPDRALREGARLAYSDIRELFDEQGNFKPVKEWPDAVAAAIAGVEVVKRRAEGETDTVTKVKVWDKPAALGMLYKHLGLLKDRVELSDPDGKPVSFTLKIGDRGDSE